MGKLSFLLKIFIVTVLISGHTSCKKEEPSLKRDLKGSFEISVSGFEESELSGESSFDQVVVKSNQPGVGGATLSITMMGKEMEFSLTITITKTEDSVFENSTYSFDENSDKLLLSIVYYSANGETAFIIESGTVELTKAENDWVEGIFSAQLSDFGGNVVNITGSFTADGVTLTYG